MPEIASATIVPAEPRNVRIMIYLHVPWVSSVGYLQHPEQQP